MFNFDPMIVQAEVDYRAERMSGGKLVRRHRTRVPFVGRQGQVSRRVR